MKLAPASALAFVLAGPVSARAETSFEEYGSIPIRPAAQLSETQCDLDVQFKGGVVTVEQTQRLSNSSHRRGPYDLAAAYNFDLPASAVITGFAVRTTGGLEQAMPVGQHETVGAAARPMLGTDPAILVARGEGAPSQYAIYVQPYGVDQEVTLITRYTALAEIIGGALRFTLPGRTGDGMMTVCRGTLRATGGPGASIGRILVDGASTTARPAAFVVDAKPVTLTAELVFASKLPIAWTQTEALSGGFSASVITIAAPPLRTQTPMHRRALLVVDTSRSMELVGRHNVAKVIQGVTSALPANIELDAILYDRTAKRVFDAWKPMTAESTAAIEKAIALRPATNGSDLEAALRLAHTSLADGKATSSLVIVISDGVLGDVVGQDLTRALDGKTSTVDVLAVIVDPARTSSPGATALRAPVSLYGGSFVEVASNDLDGALALVDDWMRPSWLLPDTTWPASDIQLPDILRSGTGLVRATITLSAPRAFTIDGESGPSTKITPRPGPTVPVAALVLANVPDLESAADAMAKVRTKAIARAPYVSTTLSFAALTTVGKIAKNRTAMVRGGGPYERITEYDDPATSASSPKSVAQIAPSAIAKDTLERLFRDQLQPKAFACYQRALGLAPTLSGTVHFTLHLGRGEISQVRLAGLGNAQLDACLLDAAYVLNVPMPDFSINADDQTIARYPLTFNISQDHPVIVLGDADSSSPIDIDAIQGGVPTRKSPIKVDAKTPLGTMRPTQ